MIWSIIISSLMDTDCLEMDSCQASNLSSDECDMLQRDLRLTNRVVLQAHCSAMYSHN